MTKNKVKSKVYKIIIIGDGGIGKTSLRDIYSGNQYHDHQMTLGVDFSTCKIELSDQPVEILLVDFSGQNRFRFFLKDFVGGVAGFIACFDVSRLQSFLDLEEWIQLVEDYPEIPMILVGTKSDLGYHSQMNEKMAKDFAFKHNMIDYVETSAKNGYNVFKSLDILINCIIERKKLKNEIRVRGGELIRMN